MSDTGASEAGTAGGWVYFGGAGVPVVFPADAGAYLASGRGRCGSA